MRLSHAFAVCVPESPPRFKAALQAALETYRRTHPVILILDRDSLRFEGRFFWVQTDSNGGLFYGLLTDIEHPARERFEIPIDGEVVPIIVEAR